MNERLADLYRQAGLQPAWQRTPEAQPGYTPPRPRPRQMRPAIARLYDPNQGVRDQAAQQVRQERELAALSQRAAGGYSGYADRNQVEEFGRSAMEMTGAPAWARGIQDVQNGRPGEAIPEFLWGALNTAGIATLPLGGGPRLPTRAAPPPLAQALPEPMPSVARPQRPPATASSAAPVRYRFSTEEEGARVYGFDSGGRDYDVILPRSPDGGVEVHFTRGGGDSWRQTGDASPFQARAVFSRVLGAVREDAATHGAPVYRFHGMTPEQQALYGSDRARQALDPPQGYRLESDGGGWRWVRTATPYAGQSGAGQFRSEGPGGLPANDGASAWQRPVDYDPYASIRAEDMPRIRAELSAALRSEGAYRGGEVLSRVQGLPDDLAIRAWRVLNENGPRDLHNFVLGERRNTPLARQMRGETGEIVPMRAPVAPDGGASGGGNALGPYSPLDDAGNPIASDAFPFGFRRLEPGYRADQFMARGDTKFEWPDEGVSIRGMRRSRETVPIASLNPTQIRVWDNFLNPNRPRNAPTMDGRRSPFADRPGVVRVGDEFFVVDGHNRIAEAAARGETSIDVTVLDGSRLLRGRRAPNAPDGGAAGGGQTYRAYRGLSAPFDAGQSARADRAQMFSDSERVAQSYAFNNEGKPGANVMAADLSFSNPLEIDAGGALWGSIPRERLPEWLRQRVGARGRYEPEVLTSTDEINLAAQNAGYDGVIYRNIVDSQGGGGQPATVFAVLPGNRNVIRPDAPNAGPSRPPPRPRPPPRRPNR